MMSTPARSTPFESGALRKLSTHNDALVAELNLVPTEDVEFKGKDGSDVHGLLTRPADFKAGSPVPIDPVHSWRSQRAGRARIRFSAPVCGRARIRGSLRELPRQFRPRTKVLRAGGFLPTGDITKWRTCWPESTMWSRWASPIPIDLGSAGWSYGGIFTDFMIASDTRFKAAISGAGAANELSYLRHRPVHMQYGNEVGPPWNNHDLWIKMRYPFLQADYRIRRRRYLWVAKRLQRSARGRLADVPGAEDARRTDGAVNIRDNST